MTDLHLNYEKDVITKLLKHFISLWLPRCYGIRFKVADNNLYKVTIGLPRASREGGI